MKRSGLGRPTGEKLEAALERQREQRAASAQRWQEKEREKPRRRGKRGGRRIREKNTRRQAEQKPQQFGVQAEICRGLPCCVLWPELYQEDMRALEFYNESRRISDPHHSPTVGAGGKDHNTAPVSHPIHRKLDSPGNSEASVLAERGLPRDWFRIVAARLHKEIRGNREQGR